MQNIPTKSLKTPTTTKKKPNGKINQSTNNVNENENNFKVTTLKWKHSLAKCSFWTEKGRFSKIMFAFSQMSKKETNWEQSIMIKIIWKEQRLAHMKNTHRNALSQLDFTAWIEYYVRPIWRHGVFSVQFSWFDLICFISPVDWLLS